MMFILGGHFRRLSDIVLWHWIYWISEEFNRDYYRMWLISNCTICTVIEIRYHYLTQLWDLVTIYVVIVFIHAFWCIFSLKFSKLLSMVKSFTWQVQIPCNYIFCGLEVGIGESEFLNQILLFTLFFSHIFIQDRSPTTVSLVPFYSIWSIIR